MQFTLSSLGIRCRKHSKVAILVPKVVVWVKTFATFGNKEDLTVLKSRCSANSPDIFRALSCRNDPAPRALYISGMISMMSSLLVAEYHLRTLLLLSFLSNEEPNPVK